ncbi:MAG: nucleotide sugar dehydrogenase [Alphaproteobacteria bacterium]|nr:nucleotide sugar dehydrogenase [Alphaproteobacteria bacterium]
MNPISRIVVIGLGYVGLPLAIGLAKRYSVTGFDLDRGRVDELNSGTDRTGEIAAADLKSAKLTATTDPAAIVGADVYIITVPTPVDEANRPDLGAVTAASRTVGKAIRKGAIVVLESTVYPGVTEEIVGPEIAKASGLESGRDFFIGYSPERINPGDKTHTVARITKVVAGQTETVAKALGEMYGSLNGGNIFIARNIRTAEAAKVIENAQRDINIAFINEVTMIFNKMGLSIHDVLAAARTKWNFLPFTPGLVGGHCISVDPYYLAEAATRLRHHPEVILAGRRINDGMASYVAAQVARAIAVRKPGPADVLVLGLAFKENVPDLRNTKVIDVIREIESLGHRVDVHDPVVDPAESQHEYGQTVLGSMPSGKRYDAIILAVAHEAFVKLPDIGLANIGQPGAVVYDVKGLWREAKMPGGFLYLTL